MCKRTKKDEDEYNAQLRREEPIKTDIIQKLRADNRRLLENQQRLLNSLQHDAAIIFGYRAQVLADTEQLLKSDAISGFYWDSIDGWHRVGEKGTSND